MKKESIPPLILCSGIIKLIIMIGFIFLFFSGTWGYIVKLNDGHWNYSISKESYIDRVEGKTLLGETIDYNFGYQVFEVVDIPNGHPGRNSGIWPLFLSFIFIVTLLFIIFNEKRGFLAKAINFCLQLLLLGIVIYGIWYLYAIYYPNF